MSARRLTTRDLRAWLEELLMADDFDTRLSELTLVPARQVINPLFAKLYAQDDLLKMRTVKAMGVVVSNLAEREVEAARVIMRRLMWNLNDESGGVGWGSPEAMGEIMAASEPMAREYAHVLVSYIREDGNFLEHDILQRGVLWGLARLAEVRPQLLQRFDSYLLPYLRSDDPVLRGLAVKASGAVPVDSARPRLETLLHDKTEIRIFVDNKLHTMTVAELAARALELIDRQAREQDAI